MPYEQFANNATTTLSAGCTNSATSISVTSSTPFPSATNGGQFRVLIGTELLIVTAISGTTWTVTRGAEGTTAASHSSGDAVTHLVTRDSLYQFGLGGGDYFRSGYFSHGQPLAINSTATMSTGTLYLRPFLVPVRRAFDQIGVNITTGATAGGVLRMGLYYGNGIPATLISDAGTVASTSTGNVAVTVSWTLDPGVYWLACVGQTASCSTLAPSSSGNSQFIAGAFNSAAFTNVEGFTYLGVTGALPSSLTAASVGTTSTIPLVGLRAA